MKRLVVYSLVVLAVAAGRAWAGPSVPPNLSIDFRTAAWAPAAGQMTYTVGDVTAIARETEWFSSNPRLFWKADDGLGVDSHIPLIGDVPDEIEWFEILEIQSASPKSLTGAWVTQLFPYPDGTIDKCNTFATFFLTPFTMDVS